MSDHIDISVLEVLCSKICHDLISPVGAIHNGLEVIEEIGLDGGEDVISLIAFSAKQASAKLQAFRLAYGAGTTDASLKLEDVYNTIQRVIEANHKITQEWDHHEHLGPETAPRGFYKMLTAALMLAIECLPKGGKIKLSAGEHEAVEITAEGVNAGLKDKMVEALGLRDDAEIIEPKLIHSYLTALIAKSYGFSFSLKQAEEGIVTFELGFE